jgi:hypothetical protein
VRLQFPAQPTTTRTVNVSSVAQFNAAAAVSGTRVNITAGWPTMTTATINASDIDVIIPQGVAIGAIELGVWPRAATLARIRIRKPDGAARGGRMGQYRDFPLVTDVTLDSIDMNGDSGFGPAEGNSVFRVESTRVAVLNVRANAPGALWTGNGKHAVIANSNFFHGASTRAAVGFAEGWGLRNGGGPFTVIDSRIQGTRYNNLRVQPMNQGGDLIYVARTTFVNTAEGGRVAWLFDNMGNNNFTGAGAIIEDSTVYSYFPAGCGAGMFTDLRALHARYSRVRNTRFHSGGVLSWSQATLNNAPKLAGGDHDWSVGNTFASLTSLPLWGGPGDPTQIPLRSPLSLGGEGLCLSAL